MFEGAGVGAANQVGDDEGRAGCMLGGGSLVKEFAKIPAQFHWHTQWLCLLSVQQLAAQVIFCYTCKPEVDFWIYGAGRGCLCHKENTYWSEFLSFLKGRGGCQVCNLRQTGTQTQTQSSVTKRSEWLSLRTRCLSVGLSKPQSWGNKNTSLFSLVHLQMLKCVIPVQVLSHAAEWWGDKLNALSPLTAHFHHCYGTVQSQVTKRLI